MSQSGSYQIDSMGTVTSVSGGTGINITGTAVAPIVNLDVPISIANGGTNATSMTNTDGVVYFDGTRLTTTTVGTVDYVLTSNGAGNAPTFQPASASGSVTSVSGGNNITITGTSTAPIVNVSGTTNHAVQVGNATNSLTSLGVGTNGQVILGATAANPSWITPAAGTGLGITTDATHLTYALSVPVSIANGGTNATSMTNTDGVVYYDGTLLNTTPVGTATNVLTSNGAGNAPTFQAIPASGVTSITGDTGAAQTGAITLTGGTTGASFGGAAGTVTMTFAGITANGGTVNLATDATASAINVGTGAGVKTTIVGSVTSTSATTLRSGSGALNVTATGGPLTINSGVGALGISTDASATTISIGTGGAVKGLTLGSTSSTSSSTLQSGSGALNVTSTGGTLTINSGVGALGISTDASATTVSIATGGAVKGVTLGSTSSTSATTVQSGSGALNVTATGGALTINSGVGALSISNDASATTVTIATGGAAKTVTLGSTTTTSSLVLSSGSGNIVANSGLTVSSTGVMTNTVQPAFSAYLSTATSNNVTGDATTYQIIFDTKLFDNGTNYNTGTGVFTAPVTGIYNFTLAIMCQNITATVNGLQLQIITSTNSYQGAYINPLPIASGGFCLTNMAVTTKLTAADTVHFSIVVAGSTKNVGIDGGGTIGAGKSQFTYCSGFLVC